ncbi:MAG: short chain dehydrogenase [marine bacterium B5-7]|nr:MAG: short chain dehydrogenase [marine bacterium B5-7]
MINLDGQKAIVLGGTSGIGLAVVEALHMSGVEVIAASRRGQISNELTGVKCEMVNVLDRDGLDKLFARHAPFDILVNAATGGERAIGPFMDMDLDAFQGSFAKLWGYVNSVQIGTRHMSDGGSIVLISGFPARKSLPGFCAISTVGNAVEGFARAIAPEISPRRINVVSPGIIDTPMFAQQGEEREQFLEKMTRDFPIPRAGTPDEIADGVLFVLRNRFITGTTVDIDGGALLP